MTISNLCETFKQLWRIPRTSRAQGSSLQRRSGMLVAPVTPDEIGDKIAADVAKQRPTNWRRIRAPRLGIFATFSRELRQPWYWYLSADEQAAFDRAWLPIVEWHEDTIERFGSHHPNDPEPIVRELLGAPHYVYINNEAFVVREMREFLLGDVGD
jgi:hypothetical protein